MTTITVNNHNTPFGVRPEKGDMVINEENGARFVMSSGARYNDTLATVQNGNAMALSFWSGTQAEYDALTPDEQTIYFII